MGLKNTTQPRLPSAPVEYDARFMEQLISVLRLYFNQLDNASPAIFASQGVGTTYVVTALTFAQPDLNNPGQFIVSLPTEADLPNLRLGDVYRDTQDGVQATSQMLRIKTST
jgi:hypothetical protein